MNNLQKQIWTKSLWYEVFQFIYKLFTSKYNVKESYMTGFWNEILFTAQEQNIQRWYCLDIMQ